MFEHLEDLGPVGVLARAVDRRRAADAAEAELLAVAARWADLHRVLDGVLDGDLDGDPDGFRVPGMQRLVPLAGEGTPQVAEFAAAELGAALGVSTYAAQSLVGDALELRHRLPRLWARVLAGSLQAWRGRRVAERTRCLTPGAAGWVDAQVAPFAHKVGLGRVIDLVDAALVRFDPEAAGAKARAAADARGVWLGDQMTDGTRCVQINADALDAAAFDHTVAAIADALGHLGDTDVADVRRAKAIGAIADPQTALDLLTGDQAPDEDADTSTGHAAGATAGNRVRRAATGRPRVTLYIHLHQSAITGTGGGSGSGGGGVGRVEGLGPVTLDQIHDWVGRSDLVLTPVLDLADRTAVDAYETPHRIRETVILRNPCCPFPWCNNLSRTKDIDHIVPYLAPDQGGPPGQTGPDTLAPLCRRHHRIKTHGGWTYTMPEPGLYLWRSPAHRHYLVDHTGTTPIPHTA